MSAESVSGLASALGLLVACLMLLGISQLGWLLQGWDAEARRRWTPRLIALAVGVLAGDIVLHLVPHGLAHGAQTGPLVIAAAAGLLLMFALDTVLRRLHRHSRAQAGIQPLGRLSLGGDAGHNFTDGLMLGVAFAVDPVSGLAVSAAILAHELAQELGEAGILLESGYPLARAMRLNLLSALAVVPGALLGFGLGDTAQQTLPWLHLLVAGSFAYLIVMHLLPRLVRAGRGRWPSLAMWGLGGALWVAAISHPHAPHEHRHRHPQSLGHPYGYPHDRLSRPSGAGHHRHVRQAPKDKPDSK